MADMKRQQQELEESKAALQKSEGLVRQQNEQLETTEAAVRDAAQALEPVCQQVSVERGGPDNKDEDDAEKRDEE